MTTDTTTDTTTDGTGSGGLHAYPREIHRKWQIALPAGARWYAVPHTIAGRLRLAEELRGLAAGSQVVLCDGWPRSRARIRALASRADVRLLREYIALPTLSRAAVLVEDDGAAARYVAARFGTVPPVAGLRGRLLAYAAPIAIRLFACNGRSLVFGGRVVIGSRP